MTEATEAGQVRGRPRKRAAILRAAIEVFVREGYDGASLDVIAAEAEVVKRTIYNHFGDKESLFLAAFEDAFDRTNARTLAALESFPEHPADVPSELIRFGQRLAGCLFDQQASTLRELAATEAVRHRDLVASARQRGPERVASLLAAQLDAWAEQGLLVTPDPQRAAYHFLALVTSEVQARASAGRRMSATEADRAVEDGVHAFLRAYGVSRSTEPQGLDRLRHPAESTRCDP